MKKGKFLLATAFILSLMFFGSSSGKAATETCTLELGGAGHCVSLVLGGVVIGYECDSGSGQVPCNH